jgi:pimeloyl-ACP methyl ester carboxylesterase
MAAMSKSPTQSSVAVETKRVASGYYKTFVESGHFPVNGFEMYYEVHGTGKGTPLATIPPFLGLANVFPALVAGRQLIAVEPRGYGRSSDADRPLSFEETADDIAALLNHRQIEQVDIFGESFGGIVAVRLAIRYPQLVRRVAVYATALRKFGEVTRPESMAEFMRLTPDHRSVRFQRESYGRVAPDPANFATLFGKSGMMAGMWGGFSDYDLKSIKVAVLIAAGDHDNLGPRLEHHLEMVRLIPNAQLAIIPDAGHFVLNENPEKLLPVVAAFFEQPTSTVPFATTQSGFQPGETR